jgi:hypothetical protein
MKALITSTFTRRLLAGMAFSMAFLLTPRAWVEIERQSHSASIPVQQLERRDNNSCLWCSPQEASPCGATQAPAAPERLRLNPDDLPSPHQSTPCQDASPTKARPSA